MPIPHPSLATSINRRSFLRVGGGLALASGMAPQLARGLATTPSLGRARSCIFVYLLGGPSHLDMWDLKPAAPAEIRGPFQAIDTATPGLQVCEHLPLLAARSKQFAIVRSVSHHNHNHTPMIYYTLTGREVERPEIDNDVRPPDRTDFPCVAALVAAQRKQAAQLPGYVAIPQLATRSSISGEFVRARQVFRGGGAGFLGTIFDPLCVDGDPGAGDAVPALNRPDDVAAERMERRARLLSLVESRRPIAAAAQSYLELRDQAVVLSGASGNSASTFSLDGEPAKLRKAYGNHRFGRAMLLARRLSEAGVPMTVIHFNEMTVCDGWDTHSKNFEALQGELLPMVDHSLSALLDDLSARGTLDETLIVVMGEFGRTPKINANAGRDHWGSCQSVLLAGGGIRGGQVIGASDKIAAFPATTPIDPVDIHATMFHCLGIDPRSEIHDHLGRPFTLTTGNVVSGLL
ncbi:MAG TPA: DUF1501 domain-containing protein [Pirellulales bacterium]|jgi:hypothetical protein